MNYDTEIIRSGRKTISVEITRELRVIVRAPFNMSREEITGFLQKKSSWINSHLESMRKRKLEESERGESLRFTNEEIKALAGDALRVIPGRADHFAPLVGVEYRGIT
ncbi:MAG: M48 family metallopeptidase, partial [Clostridiales bacterium]|nr:M48 family metallopeptidase [Clostridiales bacterium]